MAFECVDVRRPERAERRQPGVHVPQCLGRQPVQPPLRVDLRFDKAGLAQHQEVLRGGLLRDPELTLDLADLSVRRGQQAQYRAAVGLGDDAEGFHAG